MSLSNRKSLEPYIFDSVQYYEHQVDGVRKMARMNSFILGDDMGLGKSLQALTVFTVDVLRGWAKRAVIICPVTLKSNWAEEIQLFTRLNFQVLSGTPAERELQLENFESLNDPKVLIVNYEQVVPHLDRLNSYEFDVAIFDEAHYIKNHKAKRTQACLGLKSRRSFLLTGTPMLNNVPDLWTLLHRVNPEAFPNYWKFVTRYCAFGGWKNKQIVGAKNQTELTNRLSSVMIRRLKKDCLNLPSVNYIQRKIDLTKEQRKLYDQVEKELLLDTENGLDPVEIENALVKGLKLKQICGTTATVLGPDQDHSNKLDLASEDALELIQNGHRLVTFTQFREVQRAFLRRLEKLGINAWVLHGDVPKEDRTAIVKDWGREQPGVLVCMIQVAGIGLNMVQARHCQFLDKLWVPGLNRQAVDRLHRIGQSTTQPVDVLEYITRGTIELRIEQVLRGKDQLNESVVEQANWKRALVEALIKKAGS